MMERTLILPGSDGRAEWSRWYSSAAGHMKALWLHGPATGLPFCGIAACGPDYGEGHRHFPASDVPDTLPLILIAAGRAT